MAALVGNRDVLNSARFGSLGILLRSPRLTRRPVRFLITLLAAFPALARRQPQYLTAGVLHAVFTLLAVAGTLAPPSLQRATAPRIAACVTDMNVATLLAWWRHINGARQENGWPTMREYSG